MDGRDENVYIYVWRIGDCWKGLWNCGSWTRSRDFCPARLTSLPITAEITLVVTSVALDKTSLSIPTYWDFGARLYHESGTGR